MRNFLQNVCAVGLFPCVFCMLRLLTAPALQITRNWGQDDFWALRMQGQNRDQFRDEIRESLITTDTHISKQVVSATNVDRKDHAAIYLAEPVHKIPKEIKDECSAGRLLKTLQIF